MRALDFTCAAILLAAFALSAPSAGAAGEPPAGAPVDPDPQKIIALIDAGRYDDAVQTGREHLRAVEAAAGPEAPEVARAIVLLLKAAYWGSTPKDPALLDLGRRAVAIDEKTAGPDDAMTAESLHALASILVARGDVTEARVFFERALALREKAIGPESPEAALTHRGLGLVFDDLGDLARARTEDQRALAIQEKTLGPDDREVAATLNALASVQRQLGEYPRAIESRERCLAIREKSYGPDHPQVAWAVHNLANLYADLGEYAKAKDLYQRALAIRERILPADHPDLGYSHNSLGLMAYNLGDYAASRSEYERALAIREKAFGPDHPLVAATLQNLGNLFDIMGEIDEARALLERSLGIKTRKLGPDHLNTALTANNLGNVLAEMREFDGAERLLRQALAAREKALGEEHPDVGRNLDDLGWLRHLRGDDAGALPFLKRALAIREKTLGLDHPDVAETLESLAIATARTGDPASAYPLAQRSLKIRRVALGSEHPNVAGILAVVAALRLRVGDSSGALEAALESESVGRDHLRLTARHLSQREALRYEQVRPSGLDIALAALGASTHPPSATATRENVLDSVIRSRALVLDAIASRRREAAESRSDEAVRRIQALHEAGSFFARLARRQPDPDHPERYLAQLRSAREKKEQAERDLSGISRSARAWSETERLGLAEVRSALPAGSTLLSYVRYSPTATPLDSPDPVGAGRKEGAYAVFVTKAGPSGSTTAFVPLGSASTIDALVRGWLQEAARGALGPTVAMQHAEEVYRAAAAALRRAIWDPVASSLKDSTIVFVVPDGALDVVSLQTLPEGGDRYLIETGPLIHYLSAERDLIAARPSLREGKGLLVVGGADYDAAPTSPVAVVRPSVATAASQKATAACAPFENLHFSPLPASGEEADAIARLWSNRAGGQQAEGGGVTRLQGAEAKASAFLAAAEGKRLLHIATHGFFLDASCAGSEGIAPLADPMLLSGLAFAGANRRRGASPGVDDGLITAEEIASLDLSGAEWAVLSACDTGVGEIRDAEGVLGLRRAFQTAGAGTLIMSLWPVRDADAMEWMRALYDERFAGLETARAVRRAGMIMIEDRRKQNRSTHPGAWGAFVAYGDWR